jgi:4a-hydroxytetrahydrobiopterin dehydratase
MANRDKLSDEALETFLTAHPEWTKTDSEPPSLSRTFIFGNYAAGIAFVVRLAFAAEKRDHHPDLHVYWGKVRVDLSTHDAGGITALDTELAEASERLYKAD